MATRPMTRAAELGLVAVTVEGGLIAPEQVQKIAAADRTAKLAASYDCPKGLGLGDEIARYFRIGQALWKEYSRIDAPTVTQTAQFAHALLSQCFGFDDLAGPVEHADGNRRYRIAWEARQGRVPVVVAAPIAGKEAFNVAVPEFGDGQNGGRLKRSPVSLLQDWLNANPTFYWGLVFAGDRVRLMRDNASLTRPAWIEADLGAMFRDEMFADFTLWWLLTHASRFGAGGAAASDCALEEWRSEGMKQGTAAREKLRDGVEMALLELGQGAVEANPALRERLSDHGQLTGFFEELLRTVYRLIFLAVAEDRDLLHARSATLAARALYAESYSFTFWRERSRRRVARDTHQDAWEAMKITLGCLEHGEEMLGLPALGGLFAHDATPLLNQAAIPNRRFLEAVFNLGYLRKDGALHRINWRDLKTEELGSVYESLLEIRPQLSANGEFSLDSGAKGNARKTSGSYYTPDSLVETLLDSALDPVLEKAAAQGGVEGVLDLKVIDPACGSGHFLLGAARRMADRVARLRNEDAGKEETQAALRDVVSRCIHGVDRNPMAVELAKVALWIESVSPGQPLGFLDANIRCGDALLGVFDLDALEDGIPDEAYKPLTGDSKAAASHYKAKNRNEKRGQGSFDFAGGGGALPPKKLAANLNTIRKMPEDTVGQVEKKKAAYEAWRSDPARWATRVACDLYVSAFLLPKTEVPLNDQRGLVPTTADVRKRLGGGQIYGPLESAVLDAAGAARLLHWPLAFPDVMVERGGFDVVLGNPPYGAEVLPQARQLIGLAAPLAKSASNTGADFTQRAFEALAKGGRVGFVIPKSYTYSYAWNNLRSGLLNQTVSVVDVGQFWPDVLLEQILLCVEKSDRGGDPLLVKTFTEGPDAPYRPLKKSVATRLGSIPTGINADDRSILAHVDAHSSDLPDGFLRTRRGTGIQSAVSDKGELPILAGRNIGEFEVKEGVRFINPDLINRDIAYANTGDAVFQNIVAHIRNPKDHIRIIGSVAGEKFALLDTVNLVWGENKISGHAICAYLMSNFVNWYIYVCVYNRAVRTMHFDNYFLQKLPIPNSRTFERLAEVGSVIAENGSADAWDESNTIIYNEFSLTPAQRDYLNGMHKPRCK